MRATAVGDTLSLGTVVLALYLLTRLNWRRQSPRTRALHSLPTVGLFAVHPLHWTHGFDSDCGSTFVTGSIIAATLQIVLGAAALGWTRRLRRYDAAVLGLAAIATAVVPRWLGAEPAPSDAQLRVAKTVSALVAERQACPERDALTGLLSTRGSLVDAWGTAFQIVCSGPVVVTSAGPDRRFNTGDDSYATRSPVIPPELAKAARAFFAERQVCPTLDQLMTYPGVRGWLVQDAWGTRVSIRCIGARAIVVSAGPDRIPGTADDMPSYARGSAPSRP